MLAPREVVRKRFVGVLSMLRCSDHVVIIANRRRRRALRELENSMPCCGPNVLCPRSVIGGHPRSIRSAKARNVRGQMAIFEFLALQKRGDLAGILAGAYRGAYCGSESVLWDVMGWSQTCPDSWVWTLEGRERNSRIGWEQIY